MSAIADRLLSAMGPDRTEAGIAVAAVHQPAGHHGGGVMPPTFPDLPAERPYLLHQVLVDGQRRDVVVLDQVPSQANRVEAGLLRAHDAGRVTLPMFEMVASTTRGRLRLTSLDFPHRYADAYLRDSAIDGEPFDHSVIGKTLLSASRSDVRALYEREPLSLVLGAWNSHRKGHQTRFARAYESRCWGLDPMVGARWAGKGDPVNMTGRIADPEAGFWGGAYLAEGEKAKGTKLSESGHGQIRPNPTHGGVSITQARRLAWLSFAQLDLLGFGDAPSEAARLARAALAALAIAGDRLAFAGPSLCLRSGCDLVRVSEQVAFHHAGDRMEPVEVTAGQAIEAFLVLRDRAADAGVGMATDTISVTPSPQLAKAIEYSMSRATGEGE